MITYHKAGRSDISFLVDSRLSLLRSANELDDDVDLTLLEKGIVQYYQESVPAGVHIAYMAFDGGCFVGTGGVCFYRVLPTFHNPTGRKAYIINMYTVPEYRHQGIAREILNLLIRDSLAMGIDFISLEATKMGRSLYEKNGFIPMPMEMQLNNGTFSIC